MLPAHILAELRRRAVLRRSLSLVGYVGGAALTIYGGFAFWGSDLDAAMASGWPLMGGFTLCYVTHEIRAAIRALPVAHTPDPSNPTTA